MELKQIWDNFSERMAEIELFHRAAKKSARTELALISDDERALKGRPEIKVRPALDRMLFYDARTGKRRSYGRTERSLEDLRLHVLLHKNKQYQWLLAEAYEEFEDYLENVYAYCGEKDQSFWPLQDYGNISLSELIGKDYAWFAEQARKKKNIPHGILNKFREKLTGLRTVEKENKLKVNLALAITLIEKLRHVIVHRGGKVSNREKFIEETVEKCGLYNNGKIFQEHRDFINQFFRTDDYENLILLLEIRICPDIPLDFHASLFDELIDYLMAYAFLIYEEVDCSIAKKTV